MQSKFKIVERGFKDTVVLVPGWATDYQIFDSLDLPYNYLLPVEFPPFDFKDNLLEFSNAQSLSRVSLLGWSQGGFLASDFASENPERVDALILLGIRKRYEQNTLREIEKKLGQNKRAFLYRFYQDCFSPDDSQSFSWFKKKMLKQYLAQISLRQLVCGLDYLSGAKIQAEYLCGLKKIRIFHGGQDKIAPLKEAEEIKSGLPHAGFTCLKPLGHLFFLNPDFRERFDG